jgi:hypothetical protein
MSTIGTKIRDAKFGDIPVSIYQKGTDYILEYEDGGSKDVHYCGTNDMFWETMSEIFGEGIAPDGFVLIDIANQIEQNIHTAINKDTLCTMIQEAINNHPQLMPAYVYEELHDIMKQRLYECAAGYARLEEVEMERFLRHAIQEQVIFRLGDELRYVRIKQVINKGDTVYLNLAQVEIEHDGDGNSFWCEDSFRIVKLDDVTLTHHKLDELPAEYTE